MPFYGQENFCTVRPEYRQMLNVVGNIDAVITLVLPFLAILVLNGLILYTVFRYNSNRNRMGIKHNEIDRELSDGQPKHSKSSHHNIPLKRMDQNGYNQSKSSSESRDRKRFSRSSSSKSVMRMTKMLVIVSSSFLLLNLPSHSIRVYYFFVSWMNQYHLITHRLQSCLKLFRYAYHHLKTDRLITKCL